MPGTIISTAAVNSDFSDIATALTQSLARDGQGGMTGALLAIDGTVSAPGISFVADPDTGFRRSAANQVAAVIGGTDIFTITATGITLSVGSSITGALAITGTLALTGTQTINTTAANPLSITTTQPGTITTLTSTDASAVGGPDIDSFRDSVSPGAGDDLGSLIFNGRDSAAAKTRYAGILAEIIDPTNGSEDGALNFDTMRAGSSVQWQMESGTLRYQGLTLPTVAGGINVAQLLLNNVEITGSIQVIIVQDQKPSGTNGGSSVAGAYATRTLNTTVVNTITGASLAADQVTLPAGTYLILAVAPGYATGDFKAKIRNVTDTTNVGFGTSAVVGISGLEVVSIVFGATTIASPKAFDIQMRPSLSQATNGLGIAVSFGDVEVYSQFAALKIA